MAVSDQAALRDRFKLVVVVASLGGLPVITTLVAGLPAGFPVPVLIMQHGKRSADEGRLAWLLGLRTTLPVYAATQGMSAFTRGVTVIPCGYSAAITSAGCLHMREASRPAGDTLLATAATAAAPGTAIGVVLSGMLNDGSEGVRAIKRRGGRVLAQDPATARAPGMPSNALATGCVDFALPPDRLASALIALTMAPGGAELLTVPLPHWAQIGA